MIIVFDAQCLLCDGWVRFLLARDRRRVFRFASMQGATGAQLLRDAGLRADVLDTVLLVGSDRYWQHSIALFRILHELGWPWRLAWIGWLIPRPLRDGAYRWVAVNRFRLFGRREACLIPAPEHAGRFLD